MELDEILGAMDTAAGELQNRIAATLPPGFIVAVSRYGHLEVEEGPNWGPARSLAEYLAGILPPNYAVSVHPDGYTPIEIRVGAWVQRFKRVEDLMGNAIIGFGGRISGWPETWPRADETAVVATMAAMRRQGGQFRQIRKLPSRRLLYFVTTPA